MAAEFIDIMSMQELEIGHSKKVLFTSDQFHTWVHGDYPGTKGPMHKHTADQQFYCVQGQCTFHFPDAPARPASEIDGLSAVVRRSSSRLFQRR
jgi:hypothetical protein